MTAPLLTTSRTVFRIIFDDAWDRTEKLAQLDPQWPLPQQIRRELEFMKQCIARPGGPTEQDAARVDIGVLAVRNFDENDPEYSNWLQELDYAFKRWHDLP